MLGSAYGSVELVRFPYTSMLLKNRATNRLPYKQNWMLPFLSKLRHTSVNLSFYSFFVFLTFLILFFLLSASLLPWHRFISIIVYSFFFVSIFPTSFWQRICVIYFSKTNVGPFIICVFQWSIRPAFKFSGWSKCISLIWNVIHLHSATSVLNNHTGRGKSDLLSWYE